MTVKSEIFNISTFSTILEYGPLTLNIKPNLDPSSGRAH